MDALLFADDLSIVDLQYSVHNLNIIGEKYDMQINTGCSKIPLTNF